MSVEPQALERSVLERKERDELAAIAEAMGVKAGSRASKATLIDQNAGYGGYQLNGHVYYLGMDNNAGAGGSGSPSFFAGDTSAIPPPGNGADHTKYFTFPQRRALSKKQAS